MVSAGILWFSGDIMCQTLVENKQFHFNLPNSLTSDFRHHANNHRDNTEGDNQNKMLDWKRTFRLTLFGFGMAGPIYTLWFPYLHRRVTAMKMSPTKTLVWKIGLDQFAFEPCLLSVFFIFTGAMEGKGFHAIGGQMQRDLLPAFVTDCLVWPPLQVINFKYVPVPLQALYVNFFNIMWTSFLSWIKHRQPRGSEKGKVGLRLVPETVSKKDGLISNEEH